MVVTEVGPPGVVTTEVWGVAVGVIWVVVGGNGVEDGVGCVGGDGAGGVLLCTGLEEGDGGVEEGDTGVELGVVITGVEEGGAEEGEGWTMLDGASVETGAIEDGKRTWSVNEQIEDEK